VSVADKFNLQQVGNDVHGCSQLGLIDLIFVDAEVKINGAYYCDMLLTQKLLAAMCEICAVFFTCQLCNAPAAAHRA